MAAVDWQSDREKLRHAVVDVLWRTLIAKHAVEQSAYLFKDPERRRTFEAAVDARAQGLPAFEQAIRDLSESDLRTRGLLGPELEFKLSGLTSATQRVEEAAPRSRGWRRLFASALRWGDVVLDSVISAIPMGEAFKEIKDGVAAAVEDAEDEATPGGSIRRLGGAVWNRLRGRGRRSPATRL